jgi:hypothetical protein
MTDLAKPNIVTGEGIAFSRHGVVDYGDTWGDIYSVLDDYFQVVVNGNDGPEPVFGNDGLSGTAEAIAAFLDANVATIVATTMPVILG